MLATQAFVGAPFFKQAFLAKYHLQPYHSPMAPAIFFGCYPKQVKLVLAHQAPAIVVWIGSDALFARSKSDLYGPLWHRTDIRHIALSQMVSNTLKSIGIPSSIVPITPFTFEGFEPVPLGRHAFFYNPDKNPVLYGREWAEKARPLIRIGGFSYYQSTLRNIPRHEMPWIYGQCFCNLRLTSHDGLSNTVVEMALMGRHSLWNNPVPGAVRWCDEFDIATFVERESHRPCPDLGLREQMLDYINVPDTWKEI